MKTEMFELNEKASEFVETIKHEYLEKTGKELSMEGIVQLAIEALRLRSEECGMEVFVKAVERSGVLNRE